MSENNCISPLWNVLVGETREAVRIYQRDLRMYLLPSEKNVCVSNAIQIITRQKCNSGIAIA